MAKNKYNTCFSKEFKELKEEKVADLVEDKAPSDITLADVNKESQKAFKAISKKCKKK